MKLEGDGGSALACVEDSAEDPFRVASGYHRIAIDVMNALCGEQPKRIVVNTQNLNSIPEMEASDIVEVSCRIVEDTITPEPCGALPEAVRGLVSAVKAYERAAIEAALSGSALAARKAMLLYPAIGEWEPSKELLEELIVHCSILPRTCSHSGCLRRLHSALFARPALETLPYHDACFECGACPTPLHTAEKLKVCYSGGGGTVAVVHRVLLVEVVLTGRQFFQQTPDRKRLQT